MPAPRAVAGPGNLTSSKLIHFSFLSVFISAMSRVFAPVGAICLDMVTVLSVVDGRVRGVGDPSCSGGKRQKDAVQEGEPLVYLI